MIRNTNSEHFPVNNKLSILKNNKSNIQDSKLIETNSLRISQKNSDLMFSLDDVKSKCKSSII